MQLIPIDKVTREKSEMVAQGYLAKIPLRDRVTDNMYERFRDKLSSNPYCLDPELGNMINSLVTGLATMLNVQQTMAPVLDCEVNYQRSGDDLNDAERFLNMYSVYCGCAVILHEFDKLGVNSKAAFNFPGNQAYELMDQDIMSPIVRRFYPKLQNAIEKELVNKDNIGEIVRSYFRAVLKDAETRASDLKYAELMETVKGYSIEVTEDFHVKGFNYKQSNSDIKDFNATVTFDDVIGNDEVKDILRSVFSKLLCYDPTTKVNSLEELTEIPNSMLIFARPGTGKSITLEALINHATHMCEKMSIPFNVQTLEASDQNMYIGESEKILDKKYEKITDPEGIGLLVIEDIDALLTNRATGGDNSGGAGKKFLQHLLNKIQGVKSSKLKNYIIVATTNRATDLDEALRYRFKVREEAPGPQSVEDFVALTKLKSKIALENGYLELTDKEWEQVGNKCIRYDFSGREITNVVTNLIGDASQFEITEDMLEIRKTDPAKFKEMFLERCGKISGKEFLSAIDKYHETELREAEVARKADIETGAQSYVKQALSQEEAAKQLDDIRRRRSGKQCTTDGMLEKLRLMEEELKEEMIEAEMRTKKAKELAGSKEIQEEAQRRLAMLKQ